MSSPAPSPGKPVRTLGILLSTKPDQAPFQHGLRLAETAMRRGIQVYIYCIDDAVHGVADTGLQALKSQGLRLYACAYGAQRRNLPVNDLAAFAGLTVVSDLVASTDRFLAFN